jgi:hypothetical protein
MVGLPLLLARSMAMWDIADGGDEMLDVGRGGVVLRRRRDEVVLARTHVHWRWCGGGFAAVACSGARSAMSSKAFIKAHSYNRLTISLVVACNTLMWKGT